ncbi:hypothetical protein BJ875DRAFT_75977 [Amylocarpus encephaloides]|uniref:BAR domain-containing protein n=1 Tax=Amylocarpus encephaloides TaxID=45428 RepID=A0A9P7YSA6_9HELO|nr:hypothetical protein BJ875DRAFT_75977 [Amylocarpus encephaloides]
MNINKKLDRVKQWAGEKMGGEIKTNVSDDFKALEMEMDLRHEGMINLHKSMTTYVKSLSKRNEGADKEKTLPVGYLGQTMIHHGEDFEPDSEFGNCLISMGRANDRIARTQETYVVNATGGWLESLERSLAMMKEYQAARKKLENRRLAYDASLSKMQKAKKEDFRVEEELRSQKAKYEESSEDVVRRMQDIKEAEAESVSDLGAFLEAELEYYDRCRDELLRLKKDWPAGQTSSPSQRRPPPRPRSNTAHSYQERYSSYDEPPPMPEPEPARPSIRSQGRVVSREKSSSRLNSHLNTPDEYDEYESPAPRRANITRASTFQGPTAIYRESTPVSESRRNPVPQDVGSLRASLRPARVTTGDLFGDPSDDSTLNSASPDRSYGARSVSPATSHGSVASRTASYTNVNHGTTGRKGPPPPPPSRSKKPPPPLPAKRPDMSSTSVNTYY